MPSRSTRTPDSPKSASARSPDDADGVAAVEFGQCFLIVVQQAVVQGVHRVRAVQRDGGDRAVDVDEEIFMRLFVCHY
jgi:hypothetical protein